METIREEPGGSANSRAARLRRELIPLYALAAVLMSAAGGWYLLKELAPLLRPLILAVLLAYAILPIHRGLSPRVPAKLAGPLLVLLVAVVVFILAVFVSGNLVELKDELPRLIERARELTERARTWGRHYLPAWMLKPAPKADRAEADTVARLKAIAAGLVNDRADSCVSEVGLNS